MAKAKLIRNRLMPTDPADVRCPDCNWAMIHVTGIGWLCNTENCPNKAKPSGTG